MKDIVPVAAGFIQSLAPAPVSTKNRFQALGEIHALNSDRRPGPPRGLQFGPFRETSREAMQAEQEKKGKTKVSSSATSAFAASGNMFSDRIKCPVSSTPSMSLIPSSGVLECRSLSTPVSYTDGLCSSACCSTATPANFMGQGCEHPGPGHPRIYSTYDIETIPRCAYVVSSAERSRCPSTSIT